MMLTTMLVRTREACMTEHKCCFLYVKPSLHYVGEHSIVDYCTGSLG